MANEQILRSYLMSIGWKIDEEGYKKFKDKEEESKKRLKELGEEMERFAAIAAASATVLTASVIKISDRLTQLYYSSQVAGSSARNLQSFKSAAEQIGLSAEGAQQSVENMAMAMRMNPQLAGLLRSFNINPDQDKVQVLLNLVDRLGQLPFYQGAQYGQMFGIDPQTLLMLEMHRGELQKYYEQYQKLNEATDAQAEASRRFTQRLHDLENRFNKLAETVAVRLLPLGERLVTVLEEIVKLFQEADTATDGWSSRILAVGASIASVLGGLKILRATLGFLGLGGSAAGETAVGGGIIGAAASAVVPITATAVGEVTASYYLKQAYDFYNLKGDAREKMHLRRLQLLKEQGRLSPEDAPVLKQLQDKYSGAPFAVTTGSFIGDLSKKYGVDPSLVNALVHQEHGTDAKGNPLISPKGAIGMFQLMPKTAQLLGVDPFNAAQNADGGIHYLSDLLKKYGGNESLALAAYNAGEGRVDRAHGIPNIAETQDYVKSILAYRLAHPGVGDGGSGPKVLIQQHVEIDVNGTGDPLKVGRDVLDGQTRVTQDMQRAVSGVVDR